jgi:hypothetical protein
MQTLSTFSRIAPGVRPFDVRASSLPRHQSRELSAAMSSELGAFGAARAFGFADSREGWSSYLCQLSSSPCPCDGGQEQKEFVELCTGWAIGTQGWKRAVAKEHRHLALDPGYNATERRSLKQRHWHMLIEQLLLDIARPPMMSRPIRQTRRGRSTRRSLRTRGSGKHWPRVDSVNLRTGLSSRTSNGLSPLAWPLPA